MNKIRRTDSQADEVERLTALVKQHPLPDFVTGFVFEFGDVQGEPAVGIVFQLAHDLPSAASDAQRWIGEANALADDIRKHIIDSGETRFPYARFDVMSAPDAQR